MRDYRIAIAKKKLHELAHDLDRSKGWLSGVERGEIPVTADVALNIERQTGLDAALFCATIAEARAA